jgi:hypothetical protein
MPHKAVDGERIATLGREGKTVAEIMAACGVSKTTVQVYLVKNGIPRTRKRRTKRELLAAKGGLI